MVEAVAGLSAGAISTLVIHPFDVIKTRLQLEQNDGKSVTSRRGAAVRVIRQIYGEAKQGRSPELANIHRGSPALSKEIIRAFYRGLMPNLIGNSVSWAMYFMCYGKIKEFVGSVRHSNTGSSQLSGLDYALASGISGVLTGVATNPIWVIKTRMLSTSRDAPGAYKSIVSGTTSLYKSEGIKGFYRGMVPSLFGVSHGAIQFMAYEQLKDLWAQHREGGMDGLTNMDVLQLSAVSKMVAGSVTYPYQVVRARLQTYDASAKYNGAIDVVKKVFKHEGVAGFYKGLGPNLIRVVPSTCVTFLVYENVKFYMKKED